jgi:hypothetical protein
MYLSKSIYVRVWNCPKNAWINKYHPEAVPQDANRLARFRTGDEVGDLARGLFGPYVNVTACREDGKLDLPRMMENTRREMERGTPVICEASFSYEGLYCAVDLLKKEEDGWAIYYRREIGGSFSIKSVLPAICPNDPELDYHELEGVHNGSEAMSIFPEIQFMEPEKQERARKNLLAYCKLDTLAMVKVWEELKKAAGYASHTLREV